MSRKKSAARVLALQALYQHDLLGDPFIEEADAFFREAAKHPEDVEIAAALFRGCLEHREELDRRIGAAAERWRLERIATVDRAILRLGAYEICCTPDVPGKVAINEAIRLAKKYSTADSGGFVNGILDRIMSETSQQSNVPQRE